jgi:hypothetical protein
MDYSDAKNPPTRLTLTADAAGALERLADHLVAETLRASDDFIDRGRAVDKAQWKTIKKKDTMTAYRSRACNSAKARRGRTVSESTEPVAECPQMPEFYPTIDKELKTALEDTYLSVSDTSPEEWASPEEFSLEDVLEQKIMEKSRPEHASMVLSTGSIPGTVEDAALGFLADTEARTRQRAATCSDRVVDFVRILARIQGPTFDDPFRFLGVKWWAHSAPGATGHFIKPRDCLVIESSGMALDADGERFCYLLVHSITLDEVPEFGDTGLVRETFSACHIIRSSGTEGDVDVFCRGFVDPAGSLTERMSISQYCEGLMAVPQMIEMAYTRKLAWLLQTEPPSVTCLSPAPTGLALDTCHCCAGKLNRGVAKLLDESICILCRHSACRKCTVKRGCLQDAGGPRRTKKTTLKFCLKCYLEAKNLPAWKVGLNSLSVTAEE